MASAQLTAIFVLLIASLFGFAKCDEDFQDPCEGLDLISCLQSMDNELEKANQLPPSPSPSMAPPPPPPPPPFPSPFPPSPRVLRQTIQLNPLATAEEDKKLLESVNDETLDELVAKMMEMPEEVESFFDEVLVE